MSLFTRPKFRRGFLPASLACLALVPFLAGCGEDRSNLIPKGSSEDLIARFDEVESLTASGKCFEALNAADEARKEVESLGGDIDPRLKRSLIDGVTQLQVAIGDKDPAECAGDSDVTTTDEPTNTEPDTTTGTSGTTGTTGTTDSESTSTTGDQGTTSDENQDSTQSQGNGNGNGKIKFSASEIIPFDDLDDTILSDF